MYHLFNNEEYLGHYVIHVDLEVFLKSYAQNHSINLENLHIYMSEDFDGSGKVVRYSTEKILVCEIIDDYFYISRYIYDELTSGLTEEEQWHILENKVSIEDGEDPPHPWPKKEFKEIRGKEVVIGTYPLKLIL